MQIFPFGSAWSWRGSKNPCHSDFRWDTRPIPHELDLPQGQGGIGWIGWIGSTSFFQHQLGGRNWATLQSGVEDSPPLWPDQVPEVKWVQIAPGATLEPSRTETSCFFLSFQCGYKPRVSKTLCITEMAFEKLGWNSETPLKMSCLIIIFPILLCINGHLLEVSTWRFHGLPGLHSPGSNRNALMNLWFLYHNYKYLYSI